MRENSTWFPSSSWRSESAAAASDAIDILARRRYPTPAELPLVRVKATSSRWCHGGKPVEVGQVYSISSGDAARLIHMGRAEPA